MTKNNLIVFILTIGVFSILNTEMGVIGILPIVASTYNIEISLAGLLVSLFALAVAVSGPILPLLLSKYNRKTIMIISLGTFFVCNVISAFAGSFWLVLVKSSACIFTPCICFIILCDSFFICIRKRST